MEIHASDVLELIFEFPPVRSSVCQSECLDVSPVETMTFNETDE